MASNDDGDGCAFLFGLIMLGIAACAVALIVTAIYTFILFCSVVMTVFALLAWHRGLSFFGLGISPLHARLFIVRGVAGAVLFPAFVLFASWYYDFDIAGWLWPHIAFGGYALCSTGVLFLGMDGGVGLAREIIEINPPPQRPGLAPPRAALGPAKSARDHGSTFASWDDEEELGR